ncbi:MAG TPA: DUF1998 domain-containing protein [Methanomassiliicoccales archaeon]|nr:DUF1998 domain-containing protein [Methanomassiliicoccales archaeon]
MGEFNQIRRSQFVFGFGPGAILETKDGSRIIPMPHIGLGKRWNRSFLEQHTISDSRLSSAIGSIIGSDSRVFKLPSNDAEGMKAWETLYHVHAFPSWRICNGKRSRPHEPVIYNGYSNNGVCPRCNQYEGTTPSRFIVACLDGHMDDVDWDLAVHWNMSAHTCANNCTSNYYFWDAGGSSLSDIKITCPICNAQNDMSSIYSARFICTGRYPELEYVSNTSREGGREGVPYSTPRTYPGCSRDMRIVQRQTSALRLPETITLLTLPKYDHPAFNIVQQPAIKKSLEMLFKQYKDGLGGSSSLRDFIIQYLGNEELVKFLQDQDPDLKDFKEKIDGLGIAASRPFIDFMFEEFESLIGLPVGSEHFEMSHSPYVYSLKLPEKTFKLDAHQIFKIRTVTAQIGYRRIPEKGLGKEPKRVSHDCNICGDPTNFYPGFEGFGEGIFIHMSDETMNGELLDWLKKTGRWAEWEVTTNEDGQNQPGKLWGDVPKSPLFAWWHTLSHALIRSISIYSGYSSASIRERVYIDEKNEHGGILLYTTIPGNDGTMGGLVATTEQLEPMLRNAMRSIEACSNDPLCGEVRKTPERKNGAACHSCLLISETSCEQMNNSLDRHLLLGD